MMSCAPLAAYRSITWLTPAVSCGAFEVYCEVDQALLLELLRRDVGVLAPRAVVVGHGRTSATLTLAGALRAARLRPQAPSRPPRARTTASRRTGTRSRFTDAAPLLLGMSRRREVHACVRYSITSLRYGTPSAAGWAFRRAAIVVTTMTASVRT